MSKDTHNSGIKQEIFLIDLIYSALFKGAFSSHKIQLHSCNFIPSAAALDVRYNVQLYAAAEDESEDRAVSCG